MKSNIFKYIFFIIVIILICLSVYILYKDENNKTLAIEENTMDIHVTNEINIGIVGFDTINPILSNNRDIQYISKLIFDPLIDITKDFKMENKLAKEFSKIDDKIYIIKLNDNVYWHDKTKFTSKDVAFTINNIKEDDLKSIYKENVKEIEKVEIIDDYTIKIVLKKETPFFEYKMCFPILSSNSYEGNTLESKKIKLIGTGKYKIEQIKENSITLQIMDEKSENNIKKINVIIKDTDKDLYNSFSKGELDYILTDNIDYEKYIGTMGYNVCQIPNREYEYLALNNLNSNLSNIETRQLINNALDKNYINYSVYKSKYKDCSLPLYYEDLYKTNFDVKAKNSLFQNTQNKKLIFNLVVNKENEKRILVAQQIKEELKAINININIVQADEALYKNYLQNKNYDIILTGNILSNVPNLDTYFGGNNLSNYNNKEIKQLLNEIKNTENPSIIKEKYLRIIEIYSKEVPFISLYLNSLFILTNVNLKGDLSCNWYNLFYNIDNWYKIE